MSATATPEGPLDLEAIRAEIRRRQAETDKLVAESNLLSQQVMAWNLEEVRRRLEVQKLGQEARTLDAAEDHHRANARKLDRDRDWVPILAGAGALGGLGGLFTGLVALLKSMGVW